LGVEEEDKLWAQKNVYKIKGLVGKLMGFVVRGALLWMVLILAGVSGWL
jgi:hypothetical protein